MLHLIFTILVPVVLLSDIVIILVIKIITHMIYHDVTYLLSPIPIISVSDYCVVTGETSTTGDGPLQQDGGDIGASVIDNLSADVSVQCESN